MYTHSTVLYLGSTEPVYHQQTLETSNSVISILQCCGPAGAKIVLGVRTGIINLGSRAELHFFLFKKNKCSYYIISYQVCGSALIIFSMRIQLLFNATRIQTITQASIIFIVHGTWLLVVSSPLGCVVHSSLAELADFFILV